MAEFNRMPGNFIPSELSYNKTMSDQIPSFELLSRPRRHYLRTLRDKIEPIYRNRLHTHFTDHSIVHCDRVADLAQKLLKPLKKKLNDDEALVLYGGCYLHDIGMHNEHAGEFGRLGAALESKGQKWADVPRAEALDMIRRRHHEISADMVIASLNNGKPPINFTFSESDHPSEIAGICEAHCVDTAHPRYAELTQRPERSTMRLRLLSAVLRLADVLDEAHHRALVEQARTLNLNLESRMHWWRHHFTREIEVEEEKNRITVWFGFPSAARERYVALIPSLQMPWIEQELARHRPVLAENALSWHIGWQAQDTPFQTLEQMPPEVESYMLQEQARRKHLAAKQSRVDLLKHFDDSCSHLVQQLSAIEGGKSSIVTEEYLTKMLSLATDLWEVGSHLTARQWLRSAHFWSTTNGRSVSPLLNVRAATQLAKMQIAGHDARAAISTMLDVKHVVSQLPDTLSEKVTYYRALSSIALTSGYFGEGVAAADQAMQLSGPGGNRDDVAAELAEARFLEGQF